jgi:hypothetical protein
MYGPHKVGKIGKMVKKLRKKMGKISIRAKVPSPSSSVARATTIDILPDDILLQIFDFCRVGHLPLQSPSNPVLEWHKLIHVCRRWREIIFSSPLRLDLCLICKHRTPVRKNLGLWPTFPIILDYDDYPHPTSKISSNDEDNIIAALEHPDRVRCLRIPVTKSVLEKVATVAQEPFPILTQLWLSSQCESVSALPSTFLGGSAPRLRGIYLEGIPFPALPTILSSTSDLVVLYLHRMPHVGYISPEVMVTSLVALPRLDFLYIGFQFPPPLPGQISSRRRTAPPTQVILPVLTIFEFYGTSEYLEDLVAQFDAPRLASIHIKVVNQLVIQVPQLFRFICHTQIIEQACTMDAGIYFYFYDASSVYLGLSSGPAEKRRISLDLQIACLDQVSHLAEVLAQFCTVFSDVRHLFIYASDLPPSWRDNMDHTGWLALLRQFTATETLFICHLIAGHVSDALNDVTAEMAPEILPALCSLYLVDEPARRVEEFITARQLSGLPPVTLAHTQDDFRSRRKVPPFQKNPLATIYALSSSSPPAPS